MIKIEIWSDINCPFCYIGKRNLEAAIRKFPKAKSVVVDWKSFELSPEKYPNKSKENSEKTNQEITKMAKAAGLDFNMNQVIPCNTFDAHRLIHLSKSENKQEKMIEKLFHFKFVECKDISERAVLKEAGIAIGLSAEEVKAVLDSDKFSLEVKKDEEEAADLEIKNIPYFRFNKEQRLIGARSVEVFLKTLEDSARFEVNKFVDF